MERNLRELTINKMMRGGNIYFYDREIDYDKIYEWYEDTSIDISLEVELGKEQSLNDSIYNLTLCILKANGTEIKPISYLFYYNYGGIVVYFEDDTHIYIENDAVKKGIYRYFKTNGYNKKDVVINTLKNSYYWEVGIGSDFDYSDIRIHCTQFLLESTIRVIKYNLIDDDI